MDLQMREIKYMLLIIMMHYKDSDMIWQVYRTKFEIFCGFFIVYHNNTNLLKYISNQDTCLHICTTKNGGILLCAIPEPDSDVVPVPN